MGAPSEQLVVDPTAFVTHPIILEGREDQLAELRTCLASPGAGRLHCWVHGPPGTGKTLLVRHLLVEELKETSVVGLYADCRSSFRMLSVVERLLDQLRPLRSQQRLREYQLALLQKEMAARQAVIALDEIDVLPRPEIADLLHQLASLPTVSLICISSSRDALLKLPDHVRSRLAPRQILFPRYDPESLVRILSLVADRALRQGTWGPDLLDAVEARSYGDARRGIALLRHAVARAQESRASGVRPEHVVKQNFDHYQPETEELLDALGVHYRTLYELVRDRGPLTAITLEELYEDACRGLPVEPVASRTVHKYLSELCKHRLLRKEHGAGTGGWIYAVSR